MYNTRTETKHILKETLFRVSTVSILKIITNKKLTFVAVGIKLAIWVRKACLVFIAIQGSHPK